MPLVRNNYNWLGLGIYIYIYVCVCVYTNMRMYVCITEGFRLISFAYIYIYVCVFVSVHIYIHGFPVLSQNITIFSKNETQFLPCSGHIDTAIWLHYMDANKTAGEEARRQLHKNAACNLEQVLAATPHKTPTVRPPASYHENYSS